MESADYLIIGGGIAGTTAADTIRAKDAIGSITIISDEPYRLYSRILLSKPNFFLEKIPFDQIWLKKESWYAEANVTLLAGTKAAALDSARQTVTLEDGRAISYKKLLIAIGGCVRTLSIPGADKNGIFYLRTLDDTKAVIAATKRAKRAIVIGGGFVSFEMCDMLRLAGIDVTLLLREPYYWQTMLDEPSGKILERALEKGGVKILREVEAAEFTGDASLNGVMLKNGKRLDADFVIAGIGISCPIDFIARAGVPANRGVLVDEYLASSTPNVWGAGDAAEFKDVILGEQIQLGNWVNAQMQGRVAGLNMAGEKTSFRMVSFYTTQGFNVTIAFVGDSRPLPDRTIIARGSAESNSYARILIKDHFVIGATLINRTHELGPLTKMIEKKIDIAVRTNELADANINLATIL